jgi:hypothetical protein
VRRRHAQGHRDQVTSILESACWRIGKTMNTCPSQTLNVISIRIVVPGHYAGAGVGRRRATGASGCRLAAAAIAEELERVVTHSSCTPWCTTPPEKACRRGSMRAGELPRVDKSHVGLRRARRAGNRIPLEYSPMVSDDSMAIPRSSPTRKPRRGATALRACGQNLGPFLRLWAAVTPSIRP